MERVRIGSATIVPGDGFSGQVEHRNLLHGRDIEIDAGPRNRGRMERMVRVLFAGMAAQRRFDEASVKDWHAGPDYHQAMEFASHFVGSTRELEAYLNLLLVQAEGLFDRSFVWEQVTAVAEALLAKRTLEPSELRQIIRRVFQRAMDRQATARKSTE